MLSIDARLSAHSDRRGHAFHQSARGSPENATFHTDPQPDALQRPPPAGVGERAVADAEGQADAPKAVAAIVRRAA